LKALTVSHGFRTTLEEGADMNQNGNDEPSPTLEWRNSAHICALSDGERHVGHIVKIGGRWHAFDAMHSNEKGDGFRSLGTFASVATARDAVEQAYRSKPEPFAGAA
jgi:hypothetical protein